MTNTLRKGQVLVTYLTKKGISSKDMQQYIFYMSDNEFDEIINWRCYDCGGKIKAINDVMTVCDKCGREGLII